MTTTRRASVLLMALLSGLVLLSSGATNVSRADEESGVPSFRKSKDKDSKEFVARVFEAIVKEARLKTKNHTVKTYEYTLEKDKENRKVLKIVGTYDGAALAKNVNTTIEIKLDTSNDKAWEVLNIEYKDENKVSLAKPNTTKIQALIKQFNK